MKTNVSNKIQNLITLCGMTDTIKSETLKKELESILEAMTAKSEKKDYGEFDPKKAKEMAKGLDLHLRESGDYVQVYGKAEDSKKMLDVWHQLKGIWYRKDNCWSFKKEQMEVLSKFIGK